MKMFDSAKKTLSDHAPIAVAASAVVSIAVTSHFLKKSPAPLLIGATADQLQAVLSGNESMQWFLNGTYVILRIDPMT